MHLLPPLFKFRQTGYTGRKVKNEKFHKQVAKRDWKDEKMLNTLKPLINQLKKKHTYFILGIALLFTIIRLYLYSKAIYGTDMSATYDDQLLIRYAQNILDGKWLGEYTTTTLSKGISYSLFLVLAHKLHLSYAVFVRHVQYFCQYIGCTRV